MHGPERSSDDCGDGPSSSSTSSMHNGVELLNSACLRHWQDFCRRNLRNRDGKSLFTCVMAFDKHNVVSEMNKEEAARFIGLRNTTSAQNNLGGALALISRGTGRWRETKLREWNQHGYTEDGDIKRGCQPDQPFYQFTVFLQQRRKKPTKLGRNMK